MTIELTGYERIRAGQDPFWYSHTIWNLYLSQYMGKVCYLLQDIVMFSLTFWIFGMSVSAGGADRLLSQARPKHNPAGSGQALAHAALPKDFSLHLQHPCFSITETFLNMQSQRDVLTHVCMPEGTAAWLCDQEAHSLFNNGQSHPRLFFIWVNLSHLG